MDELSFFAQLKIRLNYARFESLRVDAVEVLIRAGESTIVDLGSGNSPI